MGIAPRLWTVALLSFGVLSADDFSSSGANCSFKASPDQFTEATTRAYRLVAQTAAKVRPAGIRSSDSTARGVDASSIPHRNFIDDEIFGAMANAGVPSAALSGDEEFYRRITLDLTGRIPSPADVRSFVANTDPAKRSQAIDQLLNSDEFVDKWAVWMGDWLKNTVSVTTSYSPQQLAGRNAMYKYIWLALAGGKPLRDVAYDMVYSVGSNYDEDNGATNFISSTGTSGGPAQDTYDSMLVKSASTFLGLGQYDCLLCHNGRGHLDTLNLWASKTTRLDAERMAAHFARVNLNRFTPPPGTTQAELNMMFLNNSYYVDDTVGRTYDLNTGYGNRPNRAAQNGLAKLTPIYRTGATPKDDIWRSSFADAMVNDPMFARNVANRLWKSMFNLGLVEPVDQMDPARLDPANPPDAPWSLQATHPVLLEKLAGAFKGNWYNLRETLRLIAESSAYQLSSQYDGDWNSANVSLFARHYPRRLDGEEVHDALAKASGVFTNYSQFNWGGTVKWAMQLLDPQEPRSNGTSANFMNYFMRGNRDTAPRSQAVTSQQELALMNDGFVTPKLKVNASPVLQAVAKLPSNDAIVEELFLTFLSRKPSDYERSLLAQLLCQGDHRGSEERRH